ncbi:hypothetical protein BC834DRAFT_510929 [Gloeopeniophorella convolvens]|nr:hypothetical protein BC834DRAFT_510929 [Gloeopeniophorella convolvens]
MFKTIRGVRCVCSLVSSRRASMPLALYLHEAPPPTRVAHHRHPHWKTRGAKPRHAGEDVHCTLNSGVQLRKGSNGLCGSRCTAPAQPRSVHDAFRTVHVARSGLSQPRSLVL